MTKGGVVLRASSSVIDSGVGKGEGAVGSFIVGSI